MKDYWKSDSKVLHAIHAYIKAIQERIRVAETYQEYQEVFQSITPFDVLSMHQWSEEAGLSDEEIVGIAGKLINTFRAGLEQYAWKEEDTSPFVKYLFQEAEQIRKHMDRIKSLLKQSSDYPSSKELHLAFLDCKEIEKRYLKMENVVFPYLENHLPNTRPLSILWTLHDDARRVLKFIMRGFEEKDHDGLRVMIGEYFFLVYGLLEKEELLILPVASKLLSEEDWNHMLMDSLEFGYALMDLPAVDSSPHEKRERSEDEWLFQTESGGLTLEDLCLILDTMGLDITFVNDRNEVQFFNSPKDRLFPRSPSIIGRLVKHCHPPKSVDVVEEIIESFRFGKESKASFHIQHQDKMIVITYYAIRNKQGQYKGVLEVTQDVTEIRTLEGEQRLLSWKDRQKK